MPISPLSVPEGGDAEQQSGKWHVTLPSAFKPKDLREEFILDFVRLHTMADIPLKDGEDVPVPGETLQGRASPQ